MTNKSISVSLTLLQIDVFARDDAGNTALHYAVETVQPELCYQLVCRSAARITLITNNDGKTPLALARESLALE